MQAQRSHVLQRVSICHRNADGRDGNDKHRAVREEPSSPVNPTGNSNHLEGNLKPVLFLTDHRRRNEKRRHQQREHQKQRESELNRVNVVVLRVPGGAGGRVCMRVCV